MLDDVHAARDEIVDLGRGADRGEGKGLCPALKVAEAEKAGNDSEGARLIWRHSRMICARFKANNSIGPRLFYARRSKRCF